MALRLLGPLELVADGRSLDLGGPRQQVILALLGLNVNSVTSIDHLIEAVWGENPPPTARGQVQVCISGIRKLFARAGSPHAIRTLSPGYALELDESQVDSLMFASRTRMARGQIEAGRLEEAVETLRSALALWRGPALASVQSDLVQRAATALDEKRLSAIEEYMRLRLELGRHEELTAELLALTAEHPLRERLHGFLMMALYRSGRQAEALDVYQRIRATLVEQIGVEPGRELQDLHQAILARSLEAPRPKTPHSRKEAKEYTPPRQLPASIADFTGRAGELAEIKRLLTEEKSGYAMPIVVISGRGGAGKSTLAIRAAHEMHDHFRDGVLYAELGSSLSRDHIAAQLARFLRALGVAGQAIPEGVEERMELYRTCLAARRVLVVLDDVADEDQVRPLLPGSPTCAVIATSRNTLTGLPGAYHIIVEALNAAESADMLTKILGSERVRNERAAVEELYEQCEGLPLALRIAGARLVARQRWPIRRLVERMRDEARRLDELEHRGWGLRSSIGLTYQSLDKSAKRLFRLLSMIQAPDVPSWTAAALLDTDVASAEEVLERLVDAHVLQTVEYPDARQLRYRFHNLIQTYARERLAETESPEERSAALNRVLGAWLALAETAHRREYGGDYTIIHGTAPRWSPPDVDPLDIIGDPMEWWDAERPALVAAVRQAAGAGCHELCWDLALTCVTLFEARAYFDDWAEVAHMAREAALRAGNRTGLAAMEYSIGTLHMFQGQLTEADECFQAAMRAFEAEGNEHGLALVLRNAANVDGLRGDDDAMIEKYDRALTLLQKVGDHIGAAHVMRTQAKHWLPLGDTERARDLLERALVICREVGNARVEAQVLHTFAQLHLSTGELALARRELDRVLRLVRGSGDGIGEAHALYALGLVSHREGRLDAAESALTRTLTLAKLTGERMIQAKARYTLGEIALARGDHAAGVRHIDIARRAFQELGSTLWAAKAAILLSEAYDDGDIRRRLDKAAVLLAAEGSPKDRRVLAMWPDRGPGCTVTSRS